MWETRFSGIERLFGAEGRARLQAAHVAVVGLGGVGSWAAEALARSGLGSLTLIDLDDICITNTNRQIHAVDGEVGRSKVAAMADRVQKIHPDCRVHCEAAFLTEANAGELLSRGYDYVVDAIDSVADKCVLVVHCRKLAISLVVSGGAGGKRNAGAVATADLACATHDPLLKKLRKCLRHVHGFPEKDREPFGIPCVYSEEHPVFPWSDGSTCLRPEPGSSLRLDCATGFGTASFVTGAFGFAAASVVVNDLCSRVA